MHDRRTFLAGATGAALLAAAPTMAHADFVRPIPTNPTGGRYRPTTRIGMGGTQVGSNFVPTPTEQSLDALEAAWEAGVRYFDTSPWYGLGLSERRMGVFFDGKPRDQFVLSTKTGRLLRPDQSVAGTQVGNWKQVPPFRHDYDYSADGTRRSIEESLHRLGVSYIDIVLIHDLSPDNGDMGSRWTDYLEQAKKGAMPTLTKMREEGIIKAWGLGVNTLEPALAAFDAADPDIILSATQYSLIKHEDALKRLFPVAEKRGASIVVGAPLNAGFLAGRQRYNYGKTIPPEVLKKRAHLTEIAAQHTVDLRTAALQFAAAPKVVSAIIPGARSAVQARQNAESMRVAIPAEFWNDLQRNGLIAKGAAIPV